VKLIAIAGPTASGKSAAAVALAEEVEGEIVSCDSLAVYRTLDVGTAKPSDEDRARIAHHLIDVVDPDQEFTAARYVELADRAIAEIVARGKVPVVAGGTGLYLRALTEGLFPSPPPDETIRARLKAEAARDGWPALHARLATIDPEAAARIAPTDPIRIERALEVFEQTGRTISSLHKETPPAPRYRTLTFLVDPPSEILEPRIAERTRAMLAAGLVDETRAALARYGRNIKPLGAVGYKEALAFLDGDLPERDLENAIRVATRRFAKRQRTWFAKVEGTRIPDAGALPVDIIRRFLDET
jgi:tRNA dimethylallyltransferase